MYLLETEKCSFGYEGTPIVRDISLQIKKGEVVSLLGESGAGKSTIFNMIAGLLVPQEGRILLKGQEITGQSGHVSYMLQKDLLLPFRTIEDNVILPLLLRHENKKEARQKAAPLFQEFGIAGTEKKYPGQLSGGMRQRAALLRTYLFAGEATLLDEPFSALDTLTRSDMHAWFLDMVKKLSMSVLFITHDIDEAILLSDRILILSGRPASITNEIRITPGRDERDNFTLTESFLGYKKQILSGLGRGRG